MIDLHKFVMRMVYKSAANKREAFLKSPCSLQKLYGLLFESKEKNNHK